LPEVNNQRELIKMIKRIISNNKTIYIYIHTHTHARARARARACVCVCVCIEVIK